MLISAFYLEYFHGALPCDLCITQRWFHSAIIAYSFIIILIIKKTLISKKLLILGGSILWFLSSLAGGITIPITLIENEFKKENQTKTIKYIDLEKYHSNNLMIH